MKQFNEEQKRDIETAIKWFNKKDIVVRPSKYKEAECYHKVIQINPNMCRHKFREVLVHELIHVCWNVPHNQKWRRLGYRSYGKKSDIFSQGIRNIIYRRKLNDENICD